MKRNNSRRPLAGGIFLAIGPVAGAVIGTALGQPSIGVLAGIAAGVALAGLVFLVSR